MSAGIPSDQQIGRRRHAYEANVEEREAKVSVIIVNVSVEHVILKLGLPELSVDLALSCGGFP